MLARPIKLRLIGDAFLSILLLTLAISFFAACVSIKPTRVFSGAVYASPGIPVPTAMVVAYGSNGSGFATTNAQGQYSIIEGLQTGLYTVTAYAPGYMSAEKENVAVVEGQETTNVNFYLNRSGGISGRVTDAVSALPLQNIMITASPSSGDGFGWYAMTDSNGKYSIITNLATGTYNVSALFPEGHIMKTIGGISVTAGSEVKGVDLALDRSGTISGRVTATPSGAPLGNATVYATSDDVKYFGYAETNATGYYKISSGLGTGTYTVTAMYLGWNIGQAMDVNVVAGAETSNVDIAISVSPPPASGIITGKVIDTGGEPIEDALVTADGPDGHGEARTDENGDYAISSGLESGTYTVSASALGYSAAHKSGVSVTVNQVTPNIDFQLSKIPPTQSGKISGTIQGDENPILEYLNPIAVLLVAVPAVVATMKLSKTKAKRYHLPQ